MSKKDIKETVVKGYKTVEDTVVKGYKKVEDTVVGGYKTVENAVVGGYKKIEDKFVDTFFSQDPRENVEAEEVKEEQPKQKVKKK